MLRRFLLSLAALAALVFVAAHPASAQQRIALVIGNSAYQQGPLATSLADGGLVAEALTSIGFEIVEGADVNSGDLRRIIGEFLAKVNAAGPNTIAFVYYNGYALQFEGDNYLIPVDARLARDSDIPIQGMRLFDMLRPLADTPAMTKIVVLDAARPIPFQLQGQPLAPGLGAIESAPGMLVAFSSAPGTVAPDGPGPYGFYATAIAEMVREPGLDIDTMFARVRLRTNEATQGAQTPWDVSQLQQVVMLVPGQAAAPPAGAPQGLIQMPQTQVGAPVVRRRPPPRPLPELGPEQAYAYAVEQDDLDSYSEYVRVYPGSPYSQRVYAIIRARREALLWRRALIENSPDSYWTYIQRYPDGLYVFDARRRLRRLAVGDMPPPGWRMRMYDDIPMPLAGEPQGFISVLPPAPPPRRYLAPPPAFIVGLPPPPRPGGGGLWRNPQPAFPVIIQPPPGPRPGFGGPPPGGAPRPGFGAGIPPGGGQPGQPGQGQGQGQGQPGQIPRGPAVVNQPPGGGVPPGSPPGIKGPPPGGPPVGAGGLPPGGPPVGQPKIVNQPPGGGVPPGPPPGIKGPPPGGPPVGSGGAPVGQPKIVNQPPGSGAPPGPPPGIKGPPVGSGGPPVGQPKIVNQPPGPPAGIKGPPPGGPPAGLGGSPQGQPKIVNQPPVGQPKGPPPGAGGPPQGGAPVVRAAPPVVQPVAPPKPPAPPPPPPPPQVKGPPPGPPPQMQMRGPPSGPPPGPPPQAQRPPGPPPGGPPQGAKGPAGVPKCAVTGGKQPCVP